MMPGDLLYEEKISSVRTEALFVALAFLFLVLLYWRVTTTGLGFIAGILFLLCLLFSFYSLNYRVLAIRISAENLHLQFGVFGMRVPLSSIDEVRVDETSLWRITGAGIHFSPIGGRYRVMFNFLEYPRVVIGLKKKRGLVRDVAFSTEKPQEVMQVLEAARAKAGAA